MLLSEDARCNGASKERLWRRSESCPEGLHKDSGCLRHLSHNGALAGSYGRTEQNPTATLTPKVRGFVAGDQGGGLGGGVGGVL